MYSKKIIESANYFAPKYEEYVLQRSWTGPEIIFNELAPLLKPGDKLLDMGIGTGLSSNRFKNAGLQITGIDGSPEMLKICEQNNIAETLKCFDITQKKFPFKPESFHVVISNALFHMIKDLSPVLKNACEVLLPGGIIAFTVIVFDSKKDCEFKLINKKGIYQWFNPESEILNFRHSIAYVNEILDNLSLTKTKVIDFIGFNDIQLNNKVKFTLYIAQKAKI